MRTARLIQCPHCDHNVASHLMEAHLRDTGDSESPIGCPILYLKRNNK